MNVTFDSNVWEAAFSPDADLSGVYGLLLTAIREGRINGFISEAAFRIEAISRKGRVAYFSAPHVTTRIEPAREDAISNRVPLFSFGPDHSAHPGIPAQQIPKLEKAAALNVKIIRAMNWIGLPVPPQMIEIIGYVPETGEMRSDRELLQMQVFEAIRRRGVGKAAFDDAGGWKQPPSDPAEARAFSAACAEWADGELVAAHIGYRNDVLCTNDRAIQSGTSVFNPLNRSWLTLSYGIRILSPEELAIEVSQ